MKLPFSAKPEPIADTAIAEAYTHLLTLPAGSDEYFKQLEVLAKLTSLKEKNPSRRVSPDAVLTVCGSLAGIIIIVVYEHAHVVTSKAMSQLPRTK